MNNVVADLGGLGARIIDNRKFLSRETALTQQPSPRVFISYSHDSPAHAARVLKLANDLRRDGVNAIIDQYLTSPPEGWPLWMERNVREGDFVVMVCTPTYYRRVANQEKPGAGLGVRWEGSLIYNAVYKAEGNLSRFVPILLSGGRLADIPDRLVGGTHYDVDTPTGYEGLLRQLFNCPTAEMPPIGERPTLSVLPVKWTTTPDSAGWIKSATNLLHGLLENQFQRVLQDLDPQGLVRTSLPNSDPVEDRARRVQDLIQLMLQRGPPSADVFQETILAVRSPFSPFNGDTLDNWVAKPAVSWRVAQSKIIGVGSDPCVFSDLDMPTDLRNASLLIWEGLPFRDGVLSATIRLPLLARQGAGGLIMRRIGDRSAVIAVMRQAQSDAEPALELWERADVRLYPLNSIPCPSGLLRQGSCRITLKLQADSAFANVACRARPDGISAAATVSLATSRDAGYCGIIKFGNSALILNNMTVTVNRRTVEGESRD